MDGSSTDRRALTKKSDKAAIQSAKRKGGTSGREEEEGRSVEKNEGRRRRVEGNDRFPDKGETFSKGRWNEIGPDPVFESMVGSSGLAQRVHL